MRIHRALFFCLFASLAGAPTASHSSDETSDRQQADRSVSDLVRSVGPAFECDISDILIAEIGSSEDETPYYRVSFEGTGGRCDEALSVLNYRGKSKGLWFVRRPTTELGPGTSGEASLILIHEIDPPSDDAPTN